jgi:hypothetical protein
LRCISVGYFRRAVTNNFKTNAGDVLAQTASDNTRHPSAQFQGLGISPVFAFFKKGDFLSFYKISLGH